MEQLIFKLKSGIKIKPSHKGLFTTYCKGKVTSECIAKGKRSSNPAIRKRATFAANVRKWKHEDGGIIRKMQTAAGGPLVFDLDAIYRKNKEDNTKHLAAAKNLIQKPTPANLIKAAYHAYRGSQLGLPFSGKPEEFNPTNTGIAPLPGFVKNGFTQVTRKVSPKVLQNLSKKAFSRRPDVTVIKNAISQSSIPHGEKLYMFKGPKGLQKKYFDKKLQKWFDVFDDSADDVKIVSKPTSQKISSYIPDEDVSIVSEPSYSAPLYDYTNDELMMQSAAAADDLMHDYSGLLDFFKQGSKLKKHQAFVNGVSILDSNPDAYKYVKKKLHKAATGGNSKNWFSGVGNWLNKNSGIISNIGNTAISTIANDVSAIGNLNNVKKQSKVNLEAAKVQDKKRKAQFKPLAYWLALQEAQQQTSGTEENISPIVIDQQAEKIADMLANSESSINQVLAQNTQMESAANNNMLETIMGGIGNGVSAGIEMLGMLGNKPSNNTSSTKTTTSTSTSTYQPSYKYDMMAPYKKDFTFKI